MAKKQEKQTYGNESIVTLKGADRVRKRPAVIFGSDGIEGCQHSAFEILSNSIDEAREGYGNEILITRFADHSVEIEDFGRGIPVDYNKNEERYNWELVFCELYAGGKYNNSEAENYEFSLGLNGLGLCSTQYSSEYMDVEIRRDGTLFTLHFEHGENVGGLKREKYSGKKTGTKINGNPILKFSPISILQTNILLIPSNVRQSSMQASALYIKAKKRTAALTSRSLSIRTVLKTMLKSW